MGIGPTDLHRHVQQLFGSGRLGGLSDAELLDRYVAGRDEHAFETLVLRHGSLVLRVCQGVLHDRHEAEDAFQATFLVLAHKAQGLQFEGSLSGWLHGVALRVAKKLRSQNERRARRERKAAVDPSWGPSVDPERADVAVLLHEEVDRLPESYRVPTILCYWEGLSYKLAARRLGVSEETIRGRLARSRARLRTRLARRGVIVPAGLLAAGEFCATASATAAMVPSALVGSAVRAMREAARADGAGPGSVIAMIQGVFRIMFLTQLRTGAMALMLTVGGLAAATTLWTDRHVKASAPASPAPLAGAKEDSPSSFALPQGQREAEGRAGKGADEPAPGPGVDATPKPKPWETVVRIKVWGNGSIGFGSGTVIRSTREESLILTCAHHFKIGESPQPSPRRFPHKVTVDLFDRVLVKPQAQVRYAETFSAEVVDFDLALDVGLLRIHPGKVLKATPLVPLSWKPRAKMTMVTAGCSEGRDATVWTTQISRPRVQLFDNSPYQAIECAFAPKQGRSGGGLFTVEGDLAGVSNYAEPQGNLGFYAVPESIHRLLMRNRLVSLMDRDADDTENGIEEDVAVPASRSPAPVPSEAGLELLFQAAEADLRRGNREGVQRTNEQLNEQIRIRREALQTQIQHLDTLSRHSDTLRQAAGEIPPRDHKSGRGGWHWIRSSEPPWSEPTGSRTPSSPPNLESTPESADHEPRLWAIERKLDRLLEKANKASRSAP